MIANPYLPSNDTTEHSYDDDSLDDFYEEESWTETMWMLLMRAAVRQTIATPLHNALVLRQLDFSRKSIVTTKDDTAEESEEESEEETERIKTNQTTKQVDPIGYLPSSAQMKTSSVLGTLAQQLRDPSQGISQWWKGLSVGILSQFSSESLSLVLSRVVPDTHSVAVAVAMDVLQSLAVSLAVSPLETLRTRCILQSNNRFSLWSLLSDASLWSVSNGMMSLFHSMVSVMFKYAHVVVPPLVFGNEASLLSFVALQYALEIMRLVLVHPLDVVRRWMHLHSSCVDQREEEFVVETLVLPFRRSLFSSLSQLLSRCSFSDVYRGFLFRFCSLSLSFLFRTINSLDVSYE